MGHDNGSDKMQRGLITPTRDPFVSGPVTIESVDRRELMPDEQAVLGRSGESDQSARSTCAI